MTSVGDEAGLAAFEALIAGVLGQLDEGVMLIDRDARVRLWNDTFVRMLDLPPGLMQRGADAMTFARLLADRGDYGPGDPAILAERIMDNIRARRPVAGERQMASGQIITAEWVVLDDDHFLFRLRDVSSERLASRYKDELIATVSHELRTPLTVISGALGLLGVSDAAQADPAAAELIDVAHKNSERLSLLVNDLLDIDKLQSGEADFHFERLDLRELLASAVEQNRLYAQGFGIGIDLETPDMPVIAEVDRGRMIQVMSNLLSNAAKFSTSGSRVRVLLRSNATSVRISVIDKGRGISPEFRRRLFTRFAQENRASERGESGTGLGLAICKSIIDRHQGQILVDTSEAVGTIFHIDLPLEQAEAG